MTEPDRRSLVIGLGEVGRPLFTLLSQAERDAIGMDIEPADNTGPIGVMHICIPFRNETQFREAVDSYARMYRPEIIAIHSTVLPGTTREMQRLTGIDCVYSPVRGKHAKMAEPHRRYAKFVAGTHQPAVMRVVEQLTAARIPARIVSNPDGLELAKLLETTYFGLLIAWAQEMNRFAGSVDADYREVGAFFAEVDYLPSVLFQPGVIGGHCVMPNITLLKRRFSSPFLDAIEWSNAERQAEVDAADAHCADRLVPLAML